MIGDCVIRSCSAALDKSWDEVYIDLATEGFFLKDLPSANATWGSYLLSKGFKKTIPERYMYTVGDFAKDHPYGRYVLGTGTHAVAVVDGDVLDTWDSRNEIISYLWERED
jgi:hypothetical protein